MYKSSDVIFYAAFFCTKCSNNIHPKNVTDMIQTQTCYCELCGDFTEDITIKTYNIPAKINLKDMEVGYFGE